MNAPKLEDNNCSVIIAEYSTGHVVKSDLTLFEKGEEENKAFQLFDNFIQAINYVTDFVQKNPKFECVIYNHLGEHLMTFDQKGERKF